MRKVIVLVIIGLFIGAIIVPCICGNYMNTINQNQTFLSNDIDWWPKYRHDLANTGFSNSEGPNTNNIRWMIPDCVLSSPSVYEDKLYYGSISNIRCTNADTGLKIWDISLFDKKIIFDTGSSCAIYEGKIYIGARGIYGNWTGFFCCFDAETGAEIWINQYGDHGEVESSPAIKDNKVYFGSFESIYCLNAENGNKIWNFIADDEFSGSPTLYNNFVYMASKDSILHCLDAETGEEIWNYPNFYPFTPVIYDGKIFNGRICLNTDDGNEIWRNDQILLFSGVTPAIAYGNIYVGTSDNKLYCFDIDNGYEQWRCNLADRVMNSPIVADNKVYISTGYLGDSDDEIILYCFDSNTGIELWRYKKELDFYGFYTPSIADGKLFIGSQMGLYCFGPPIDYPPPNKPSIIDGVKKGVTDVKYNYTFVTTDPNGNDLYYMIDWYKTDNDLHIIWGPKGPYSSAEEVTIGYTFTDEAEYKIFVKAINTHGAASEWSDPFVVTIPKYKLYDLNILYSIWQRILLRFYFL